ncbi:helix-turn-helix domain-containing protein [Moraxella bovoculi]|uniref:helix-turn-helix domain-containing protein n=1 Tax=Moraxella bovoculi TaxID=386891 RepID=UPI0009BBA7C6|nr:helix-turn-helix domain-containing protein [Moraxella bovoculi]
MSFKAMAWATEQEVTKTSSQTLLLVVLANFANENHESYPSVETLSRLARMDKRTVRKGLLELQAMGLIFDTQKRHQKQIVVYQLLVDGGNKNDTPNKNVGGTKLQSRGDNFVSKGGTKLHERGYKNDTQTYYEPINKPINEPVSIDAHEHTHKNLKNSQTAKPNKSTGKSPSAKKFITADELIGLGVDEQVANDYLATRKTRLTQTALSGIAKQATIAGVSLAKAIEFACEMGWQSFKADWYQNSQTKFGNPQPTSRMDELRQMASTNPTNVFVDDLPSDFQNYIGVNS